MKQLIGIIIGSIALIGIVATCEDTQKYSEENYNSWRKIHPGANISYEEWRNLGRNDLLPGQSKTQTVFIPITQ